MEGFPIKSIVGRPGEHRAYIWDHFVTREVAARSFAINGSSHDWMKERIKDCDLQCFLRYAYDVSSGTTDVSITDEMLRAISSCFVELEYMFKVHIVYSYPSSGCIPYNHLLEQICMPECLYKVRQSVNDVIKAAVDDFLLSKALRKMHELEFGNYTKLFKDYATLHPLEHPRLQGILKKHTIGSAINLKDAANEAFPDGSSMQKARDNCLKTMVLCDAKQGDIMISHGEWTYQFHASKLPGPLRNFCLGDIDSLLEENTDPTQIAKFISEKWEVEILRFKKVCKGERIPELSAPVRMLKTTAAGEEAETAIMNLRAASTGGREVETATAEDTFETFAEDMARAVIEGEETDKAEEERKKSAEYQEAVRQSNAKARARLGKVPKEAAAEAQLDNGKIVPRETNCMYFRGLFQSLFESGPVFRFLGSDLGMVLCEYRARIHNASTIQECLDLSFEVSVLFESYGIDLPYVKVKDPVARHSANFTNCRRDAFVATTMRFTHLQLASIDILYSDKPEPDDPYKRKLEFQFNISDDVPDGKLKSELNRVYQLIKNHNMNPTTLMRSLESKFNTQSVLEKEEHEKSAEYQEEVRQRNANARAKEKELLEKEEAIKVDEERKKSAEYQEEVRRRNAKARAKGKERMHEKKKSHEKETVAKAAAAAQLDKEARQLAATNAISNAIALAEKAFREGNLEDAKNRLRVAATKHSANAHEDSRFNLKMAKEGMFPTKGSVKAPEPVPDPEPEPEPLVEQPKRESNSQRKARRKREKQEEEEMGKMEKMEKMEGAVEEIEPTKRHSAAFPGTTAPAAASSSSDPISNSNDDEKMCVICMDESVTHVNVPCGHACLCASCVKLLDANQDHSCPTCRATVTLRMKVFY